jgi:hypothetical protein
MDFPMLKPSLRMLREQHVAQLQLETLACECRRAITMRDATSAAPPPLLRELSAPQPGVDRACRATNKDGFWLAYS